MCEGGRTGRTVLAIDGEHPDGPESADALLDQR